VVRYSRPLAAFRLSYNLLAPLIGAARLPGRGGAMRFLTAVHVCVPPDRPDMLRALVLSAYDALRGRGYAFFSVGLDAKDPLSAAFDGLLGQTTQIDAYVACPAGRYDGPPLDDAARLPLRDRAGLTDDSLPTTTGGRGGRKVAQIAASGQRRILALFVPCHTGTRYPPSTTDLLTPWTKAASTLAKVQDRIWRLSSTDPARRHRQLVFQTRRSAASCSCALSHEPLTVDIGPRAQEAPGRRQFTRTRAIRQRRGATCRV
jgi:hypothetical protein